MNINGQDNVYTITLPESTDYQVLEWFEFISVNGNLSTEIIRLVNDYINQSSQMQDSCSDHEVSEPCQSVEIPTNQDDLFNSLYNYQAASSAIFYEEKKQKKKMLCV